MPDLSSIVLPNNTEVTIKDPNAYHPTQTQLAALNSGITSTDVEQIATNTNNLGDVQTAIESMLQPPVINELNVDTNGTYRPTTGVDGFAPVTVNVQSYSSADAGKVVNNSGTALVSQTAYPSTITSNTTIDTTYYNSVTVNVNSVGHTVNITTIPNATVTLSKTGTSYTATADNSGNVSFNAVATGTYTVTATYDDATSDSTSVTVTDFSATESSFATLTISASANCTITVTDGTTTKTLSYTGSALTQYVSLGTWTVSATIEGTLVTRTVSVSSYTNQSVYLANITSVSMTTDFVNKTTTLPSASDIAACTIYQNITRCNVADDGTILAYPGDSSYKEDGSNGQVMVKIPKFYYKLNPGSATHGGNITNGTWSVADGQVDNTYALHPAFINASGNEVDYILIGAFENTFQNGSSYTATYNASYKMSSIGGNTIKPGNTFTRANGRTTAAARGTGWYQIAFTQIQAVQMLFAVENGFNSQYSIGQGYTYSSNSASINVGQTPSTGNYGDTTTGGSGKGDTKPVSWRGIENLWGNVWSWIDGCVGQSGYMYYTTGYTYSDSYSASGYVQMPWRLGGISSSGGAYTTNFGYDSNNPWLIVPSASTSTEDASGIIGDRVYTSTDSNRMCLLGGSWNYGSIAGLFCFYLYYGSSTAGSVIGSRLMFIP